MKENIHEDASIIKDSLLKDNSDERQELEQWLEEKHLKEIYRELEKPAFLKEQFDKYSNYSGKRGFKRFQRSVGCRRRTLVFARWMASTAAVLMIALGIMIGIENTRKKEVIPPVASRIIPAGIKKAELILANGQVIEIDKDTLDIQEKNGVNIAYREGSLSYEQKEQTQELVYNELKVPVGGECFITLADGTRVWLNAGTKLRYPIAFVRERREVFLEGEAYFEVTKENRTFIVNTSFGDVCVLGTEFGVTAYSSDPVCYTTLVQGKVSFTTEKSHPIVITPGEQVTTSKSGIVEKRSVDVEEYVGWKDGLYVFKEKRLGEIMKTLERWYGISVFFRQAALQDIPFTGNLKRYDNINVFLDALTRTGDLAYQINGNCVILFK